LRCIGAQPVMVIIIIIIIIIIMFTFLMYARTCYRSHTRR
jgi:hypothetical protein